MIHIVVYLRYDIFKQYYSVLSIPEVAGSRPAREQEQFPIFILFVCLLLSEVVVDCYFLTEDMVQEKYDQIYFHGTVVHITFAAFFVFTDF